jgi:hypothetical protein
MPRSGASGGILAADPGMKEWVDALDYKPGQPPDVRRIGNSILVVMPIDDDSSDRPHTRLVLRFEPNGDLFAAISSPVERSE